MIWRDEALIPPYENSQIDVVLRVEVHELHRFLERLSARYSIGRGRCGCHTLDDDLKHDSCYFCTHN